jgi:2'-hydroxyisoflavone reductase
VRLLLIGGTSFLGRHVAREAVARGWDVTTFNRGLSGADEAGVRAVRGDRGSESDLAAVSGTAYDVVVDTCGFVPAVVSLAAAALADSGAHYVFVSSLSATRTWPATPTPEEAPGQDCPPTAGPGDGDYGQLKAGCERAVAAAFPGSCTLVRAGLILGPHENVGRLPWWLTRAARGGEMLAPGDPDRPLQLVDARDLATFLLDVGAARAAATVNATGPAGAATMGSLLGDCVAVTGGAATLTWVPDDVVLGAGVEPWTELPLWMPPGTDGDAVWDAATGRATALGLRTRPVTETVRDTWAWLRDVGGPPEPPPRDYLARLGIDPDKERSVLAGWTVGR